ncbi:hypothetical protein CVT26_016204 [Gymnopilus dilepis]|uniref:Fungal-type protein kinase domain-containing protein n=1 Tax=Gymnopilus dilepis TaxID=231916 RepID=A0A409XYY6_9AGAR|nr:hypothetical protein CVT26_016204 [Gymnopilus dilepis]
MSQSQGIPAPHDRLEVQDHLVRPNTKTISTAELWGFLRLRPRDFKKPIVPIDKWASKLFCRHANTVIEQMRALYWQKQNLPDRGERDKVDIPGSNAGLLCRNLKFIDTRSQFPYHHPTGSRCIPDLVCTSSTDRESLEWFELEATVEDFSKGSTQDESGAQAAAYLTYLLQGRPDRTVVQGFQVSDRGVRLLLASSGGVLMTETLSMKDEGNCKLFQAFIYRLLDVPLSWRDGSVRRVRSVNTSVVGMDNRAVTAVGQEDDCWVFKSVSEDDEVECEEDEDEDEEESEEDNSDSAEAGNSNITFVAFNPDYLERDKLLMKPRIAFDVDLELPGGETVTCRKFDIRNVESVESLFTRRTTIFFNDLNPTVVLGQPVRVIKDQFRAEDCLNQEPELINDIHKDRYFPGVVQLVHHHTVKFVLCNTQRKLRMAFVEYGLPLMDVATPRAVLHVLYDLLEVTRLLYKRLSIMHCDLGSISLTVLQKGPRPVEDVGDTLSEFCGVMHLQDDRLPKEATSILLTDFECGKRVVNDQDQPSTPKVMSSGRFKARAVFANEPLQPSIHLPVVRYGMLPPPPARGHLSNAYRTQFPERIETFLKAEMADHLDSLVKTYDSNGKVKLVSKNEQIAAWRHHLYHEAESIFWIAVWWIANAVPNVPEQEEPTPTPKMDFGIWMAMQGNLAHKRQVIITQAESLGTSLSLHPSYEPLGKLAQSFASYLLWDFYYSPQAEPYGNPEYLHEAFQRLILKFLDENEGKTFMDLPKMDIRLQPDQPYGLKAGLTSQQIEEHQVAFTRHFGYKVSHCFCTILYSG